MNQEELFKIIEQNWPTYLWRLVSILLILACARILSRIVQRIIIKAYQRHVQRLAPGKQKRAETACTILQSLGKYLIWFFAIVGVVGQLGLSATMNSLLATAGIGGIAIGFGAQSLIQDIFNGLFLIFDDSISVGDYVQIGDITGVVEELSLRNTIVKGFRGEINIIPNGKIEIVTNYSRTDYLALVDMSVAYEADVARAMQCMEEEAQQFADTHDNAVEAPVVQGIIALEDSGITLRLVMRVQPLTHWACERELRARIKARFEREGIEIPYNKLVVLAENGGQ